MFSFHAFYSLNHWPDMTKSSIASYEAFKFSVWLICNHLWQFDLTFPAQTALLRILFVAQNFRFSFKISFLTEVWANKNSSRLFFVCAIKMERQDTIPTQALGLSDSDGPSISQKLLLSQDTLNQLFNEVGSNFMSAASALMKERYSLYFYLSA